MYIIEREREKGERVLGIGYGWYRRRRKYRLIYFLKGGGGSRGSFWGRG